MDQLFPVAPVPRRPNKAARERRVVNRADADHDFFRTPPAATHALLEREVFPGDVWECACGDGAISCVLCSDEYGYAVHSTDLINRGYGTGGVDFLRTKALPRGVESIVTNPPFSHATAFLRHGMALGAKKMALLCRIAFLSGCPVPASGRARSHSIQDHERGRWCERRRL